MSTILNAYAYTYNPLAASGVTTTGTITAAGAYSVAPSAYSISYANINGGQVSNSGLTVTGAATFDSDVTIQGRSILKMFETIEKRLAILTPDPKKLEKWEVLQKAYSQYKMLEALLHEEDNGHA